MTVAPSNQSPLNQACLGFLKAAGVQVAEDVSYLAQLAEWSLEEGGADVPKPPVPHYPDRQEIVDAVQTLQGRGPEAAARATRWFLSNPNLSESEQAILFLNQLRLAKTPEDAAQVVVEMTYDMLKASSRPM